MSEYIQNGTSLYKKVEPNKRVDYKTDIDEFEFKRTPETDAMLKQLCVKECFVRCENCIHKDKVSDYCMRLKREIELEDFCCWGTQK